MKFKIVLPSLVFILTCCFLVFFSSAKAQNTFTRTFSGGSGPEYFEALELVPGKGYLMAGGTENYGFPGMEGYLYMVNPDGSRKWSRTWGFGNIDAFHDIQMLPNGDFLLTGRTNNYSTGMADLWLMRVDSLGDTIWNRVVGGPHDERGVSVVEGRNGDIAVLGTTRSFDINNTERPWFLRFSQSGSLLSTMIYQNMGYPEEMVATPDGGYLFAGMTQIGSFSQRDAFMAKIDSNGVYQWGKRYATGVQTFVNGVILCADSGFAVLGYSKANSNAPWEALLIRTDQNGDTLWSKTYNRITATGTPALRFRDGYEEPNGNFVLSGYESNVNQEVLVVLDSTGTVLIQKISTDFTNTLIKSVGEAVVPGANGGYCLLSNNNRNLHPTTTAVSTPALRKTDAQGETFCRQSSMNLSTQVQNPWISSISPSFSSGGIPTTGTFYSFAAPDTGWAVCAYCPAPTADFTAQTLSREAYFEDNSTLYTPAANYWWDFGDGIAYSSGTTATVSHRYAVADSYLVCHAVTDTCGNSDTTCKMQWFDCFPPIAILDIGWNNDSTEFSIDHLSESLDGSPPDSILWDMGDGNPPVSQNDFLWTFPSAGTYEICLTVSDSCDSHDTCQTVVAPCFNHRILANDSGGLVVNFSLEPMIYSNSVVTWDLGDGTTLNGPGPFNHTYPTSGSYPVSAIIEDDSCATEFLFEMVGPLCGITQNLDFTYNQSNRQVTFYAIPPTGMVRYQWSFGDGNSGSGQTVVHTYAGTQTLFRVELTVEDSCGNIISYSEFVNLGGLGFEEDNLAAAISLHPNPGTNSVFLDYQGDQKNVFAEVRLLNLQGKVLWTGEWNFRASKKVETSTLSPGLYLLEIQPQNGLPIHRRWIKQ